MGAVVNEGKSIREQFPSSPDFSVPDCIIATAVQNFASMSGMLDLSRDEKAKQFLPRWLRKIVREW